MSTTAVENCIALGKSIRLGKMYPTALEIVDAIERAMTGIDNDSPDSPHAAKLVRETTFRQLNQDWLGVADFLEYDLPDFIEQIKH